MTSFIRRILGTSPVTPPTDPIAGTIEGAASTAVWVNVDKPTSRYIIHSEPGCTFAQRKRETPLKGVGRLKRDGGWLAYTSIDEAQKAYPMGQLCSVRGCW